MPRKLTDWNILVKKVFEEGKRKDKNYTFKQALKDASKRKGKGNTKKNNKKQGGAMPEDYKPEVSTQFNETENENEQPAEEQEPSSQSSMGGKKRRAKKTKGRTRKH